MSGNGDQLPVKLFWGGDMVYYGDHKSVHYSEPSKTVCFLSRNSSLDELLTEVRTAMKTAEDNTKLTLFGRYLSTIPGGQVVYESFPLTNNQSLEWFLKSTWLFPPVHVYVVSEKVTADISFKENRGFLHGEPLLKRCVNRVSTSGCAIDLTSDGENEDRLNACDDDGRVRKIRRLCEGEPVRKASSSYTEDDAGFDNGNAATAKDTIAATNPSFTATPASADVTADVSTTNPSSAATPAFADIQASSAAAKQAAIAFDAVREKQTTRSSKQPTTPAAATASTPAAAGLQTKRTLSTILSQLTPRNSKRVLEQVKDVKIDNAKSLANFALVAYNKAVDDPAFCEMLVDICIPLNCMLPQFIVDGTELNFSRCLSDRCHKALQRGKGDIAFAFDDEWMCRQRKTWKLGNINLIAKLYGLKLLGEEIVHGCIKKILWDYENPDEEEIEALCTLMYRVGESMDKPGVEKQSTDMDRYFEEMSKLSKHSDLSPKLKGTLVDLVDLRKNKWQHKFADTTMRIYVTGLQQTSSLKVKSSDTIYDLKAMIKLKEGFLVCKQRLYNNAGSNLDDNHTVAYYKLWNNSTIDIFI